MDGRGAAARCGAALRSPPPADVPLGLYLHIPFCRKRCKFCYFRVYTDKNADDVEHYVAALSREIELVSRLPVMGGRPFRFVYFGGGTPSFLSAKQLTSLVDRLRANINWDHAEEVTFECEPGTLSEPKVHTLSELGVTRLSLGVENFGDAVLEENGRAHLSAEVYKSWDWIQDAGFPNVNIDLIAGMVGETWDNWKDSIRRTIELSPDSVTIYQMELPFNTVYSQDILGNHIETPVADWPTKRAWVDYAFDELLRRRLFGVERLHAGQRQEQGELQLSRQSLARQRSVGHGRGQLRPCLGRALSEPARLGRLRRRAGARRVAAGPRHEAHAASIAGARDDLAAQDRPARRRLFPPTSSASTSSTNGATSGSNIRTTATSNSTATRSASPARACCAPTACCRPSSSRNIRGVRYT